MTANSESVTSFEVPVNMKTIVVVAVAAVVLSALFTTALTGTVTFSNNDFQDQTITVCPESHSHAFNGGEHCCSRWIEDRDSTDCESGDFIVCPQGNECEDNPPSCHTFNFNLNGFGHEFDGQYIQNSDRYENTKNIYTNYDKCIWWLLDWRSWILGDCEDLGSDKGYAYIEADVKCPESETRWRSLASGEYFTNIQICYGDCWSETDDDSPKPQYGAPYVPPLEHSSAVGVNAVVQDGTYKQRCNWRFRQNKWRCVQEISKSIGDSQFRFEKTVHLESSKESEY